MKKLKPPLFTSLSHKQQTTGRRYFTLLTKNRCRLYAYHKPVASPYSTASITSPSGSTPPATTLSTAHLSTTNVPSPRRLGWFLESKATLMLKNKRSPDGYWLFACSLNGSVATFHFEGKEIGQRLTDEEQDELKRSRYGDVRGRQANLAESPAQLLLEAAAAKHTPSRKVSKDVQPGQAVSKPSSDCT
ncbi:hypothetical protein RND81_10G116500 [Saponaria officinalis]|uniref:Uncharacterized protein n=1 Tax=Saponaria officinalis TaxID=3572 RepID=A0AAW1I0V1_SAPOF